jgi:hypothetical protein
LGTISCLTNFVFRLHCLGGGFGRGRLPPQRGPAPSENPLEALPFLGLHILPSQISRESPETGLVTGQAKTLSQGGRRVRSRAIAQCSQVQAGSARPRPMKEKAAFLSLYLPAASLRIRMWDRHSNNCWVIFLLAHPSTTILDRHSNNCWVIFLLAHPSTTILQPCLAVPSIH